jgi:predicted nucleotidyltransferase
MIDPLLNIPGDKIQDLCRRYEVTELSVFGSATRDDFTTDSDVDILVEFQDTARVGFLRLLSLQRELSALVGRQVDLVPKQGLKPLIRQEVLDSREIIYAS